MQNNAAGETIPVKSTASCGTIRLEHYLRAGDPPIVVLKQRQESVNTHTHDFYELVYIADGYCLHDTDGRMTLLMAGDIFIIPPGKKHRYMCNRDIKLYNCMFRMDAFPHARERFKALPGVNMITSEVQENFIHAHLELSERGALVQLLEEMCGEYSARQPGWELMLESSGVNLLVRCGRIFQRHIVDVNDKRSYMGYVTQALKYIDQHYQEEISIREIAEHIGVSGDYFSRQFKQVTGIAPVEYLRRFRFARAMELLAAGESVTEVSQKVGFRNLCHFSREFKNQLGVTPSQYRKQYAEQQMTNHEEE